VLITAVFRARSVFLRLFKKSLSYFIRRIIFATQQWRGSSAG
jgi:hypothetical protein